MITFSGNLCVLVNIYFSFCFFVKTHALMSSVDHAASLSIVWSGVAIHHSTDDRLFSVSAAIPSLQSRSCHMHITCVTIISFHNEGFRKVLYNLLPLDLSATSHPSWSHQFIFFIGSQNLFHLLIYTSCIRLYRTIVAPEIREFELWRSSQCI